MSKNTLLIIVAVIVIIGGGFFFFTNKAEAPENGVVTPSEENMEEDMSSNETSMPTESEDEMSETDEMEQVAMVVYTDDGFAPETTTISQGDAVRFVNESSARMWVGSDIHPTHTQYPASTGSDCLGSAFDQCTAVENGGSWEFTFDELGTHGYHNHVRASKRGTIIVE